MENTDTIIIVKLIAMIILPFIPLYALSVFGRRLAKKKPEHPMVKKLTLGNIIEGVCGAIIIFGVIGIYQLAPGSMVGSFLRTWFTTWYSWLAIPVAIYLFGFIVAIIRTFFTGFKENV